MKSGETVHMRVNSDDIMGCIDVCKVSNVYIPGMSLASIVRLTLSGLLESARAAELIPRRSGFEYSEMVQPILASGRNGKKLQISNTIELAEASRANNDLPSSVVHIPTRNKVHDIEDDNPATKRKKGKLLTRILEIQDKQSIDPDNVSAEELQEMKDAQVEYDALIT